MPASSEMWITPAISSQLARQRYAAEQLTERYTKNLRGNPRAMKKALGLAT